jgi:hypothetical protein
MARRSKFSREVRERAVRMLDEHRAEYESEWAAVCSIAEKIGCSTAYAGPAAGGARSTHVSMPEATRGRLERAVARSDLAPRSGHPVQGL